jgi:hypothetical protein
MRNQLLVTAMAMLVGCGVGELPGPSGGPDAPNIDPNASARQVFDQRVYPILKDKCDGGNCHAESNTANGPFVAAMAGQGYEKANTARLIGDYRNNPPIFSKIQPGHNGATYDDANRAAINAWLAKEVAERGETQDLLRTWSGCMTVEDFRAATMTACGNQRTIVQNAEGSRCKTCHNVGGNRHVASDTETEFWPRLSEDRSYLSKYFTIDEANTMVIVNEVNFDDYARGKNNHELFDLNGQCLQAVRAFYELTRRHVTANTCGAPRI